MKWKPFTKEEIAQVRAAIARAREDMDEWNRLAQVDPVKMRQPMTPPSLMGRRNREHPR